MARAAGLELARDQFLEGRDGRALRRARDAGEKRRLVRGVYAPTALWNSASDDDRYLMQIKAVVLTRKSRPILSHQSAARVWGLPIIGRWPREVHLVAEGPKAPRSKNGVAWHVGAVSDGEVVEIDGLLVTSRLRTMVDLARTTGFVSAVASLDAGIRQRFALPDGRLVGDVSKEQLVEAARALGTVRGCRRARTAAEFADGLSGSPGESASRANVFRAGMPAPVLQAQYARPDGGDDIVDFSWDERHTVQRRVLLGEYDGKVKYTRDQYLNGRTSDEVVWEEKVREDRLREGGRDMVRWLWEDALSPSRLRAKLMKAGLRPER